jgi:hypothetical protein
MCRYSKSWSDGIPFAHTIDPPSSDSPEVERTFTATFRGVRR